MDPSSSPSTKANAQVAGFLFNSAKSGNVSAQIFWLKTRARWSEVPLELRYPPVTARKPASEMTDEELMARIEELQADLNLAPPMKTVAGDVVTTAPGSEPN